MWQWKKGLWRKLVRGSVVADMEEVTGSVAAALCSADGRGDCDSAEEGVCCK